MNNVDLRNNLTLILVLINYVFLIISFVAAVGSLSELIIAEY